MEDALSVGHLQRSQVRLDAVLPSDTIVDDLDVQLSHSAQDHLGSNNKLPGVALSKVPPPPIATPTWPESGSTLTLRLGSSRCRQLSARSRSLLKTNECLLYGGYTRLEAVIPPVTDQPAWPWLVALWCRRRRDRGLQRLKATRWPALRASFQSRRLQLELGAGRRLPKPWKTRSCPL